MKLTLIGRWGGYPEPGEASSGYLLEHDGYSLLLECGSGVMSSLGKIFDITKLNAALITHYHYDHFCDIGPLQYARLVKTQLGLLNQELPIYAPDNGMYFPSLTMEPYTKGYSYDKDSRLDLGPFHITFKENVHPVPSLALRIICNNSVLGYTSDTSAYDGLASFMNKVDLLLCECSFYEDMDGTGPGHLNSHQAGQLAAQADACRLVLTHLPHFGKVDELTLQAQAHCSCPVETAGYMQVYEI